MMKKYPFDALLRSAAAAGWLLCCGLNQAAAQQADPARGAALFATHCSECHSLKEGKDKKGPSLFHIVGARAGLRDGYAYSDALRASGLTWNAQTLANYIAAPKKFLPGGKMKYDGLDNAAERADLIAFLDGQGRR